MINLLLLLNNFYPLISYRRLLLLYAVRSFVTVRNQLPAQAVKNVQSRQLIFFSLVNKQTLCMKFFQLGVETNLTTPIPFVWSSTGKRDPAKISNRAWNREIVHERADTRRCLQTASDDKRTGFLQCSVLASR